ncbi:MAG TPA: TIGR02266 family protein [Myxococcaceae bacterium]|nr:TIGR02266 family protein [Myxococcaceae bacterium]
MKPIPLRIKLPYGSEAEFVERYGSNVARGGIFVATKSLKPEGALIGFEFVLANGERLLRGEAVVVKAQVDEGGQRAGMTLRFTRLDAASKALVDRIVEKRGAPAQTAGLEQSSVAPLTPEAPKPAAKSPAVPPGLVSRARPGSGPKQAPTPSHGTAASPAEHAAATPAPPVSTPRVSTPPGASSDGSPAPDPVSPPESPALDPATVEAALARESPASDPEPRVPAPPPASRQPVLIRPEDIAPAPPAPKRRRSVPDLEMPKPAATTLRAQDVVLGIDLGTTNSRVAVFVDGKPRLVPLDPEGRAFALPSLVALDREAGALVVGDRAREAMVRDPSCAVFAAKRLIGQRARSPNVTTRANRLPFHVVPDRSGDAAVRFGDNVYSMAELSSVLIKELKDAAARHLGHLVSRAVLCVPAYFNDHQRAAMLEAANLAGLEVLRIFNEPTSVSLAFGYGQALPRKRILVYDLGGGTFGASVVEVTGDDLEVVATGGDNFLGGMDFDERAASELAGRFEQKEQRKLDSTPVGQQRLRDVAERAKIALSDQPTAAVHLPGAAIGADGSTVDLRDDLSRDRLEALTTELVERTIQVTKAVLESAGLTAEKLDEVLLVGGQSKAPLVRRRVQELCGRPPRTDVDAQAAVALGAAILGHALTEAEKGKSGVTLSEVLSAPVGIGERGGGIQRVFERNTRLPAEKTVSFQVAEGQSVGIAVFQGAGARAEETEYLGCIEAPADRAGEVTLHFALSADGTLSLTAISPAGRREVARMTTTDAPDDARAAMLAASPLGATGAPRPGILKKGLAKLLGRS